MSRFSESGEFPALPAYPLGRALKMSLDPAYPEDEQCQKLGTSSRSMREWEQSPETGHRTLVKFNKADELLCALNLNWFEVWNDETVSDPDELDKIRRTFTGQCADPCPYAVCECIEDELSLFPSKWEQAA